MQMVKERPLVRPTDQRLFVAHRDVAAQIRADVELGLNVVIFGAAGSGKTSLLSYLDRDLRADRAQDTHFVVSPPTTDAVQLLRQLAESIAGPDGRYEGGATTNALVRWQGKWKAEPTSRGEALASIDRIREALTEPIFSGDNVDPDFNNNADAVILIDGLAAAALDRVFDQYATELAQVPAIWVITIRDDATSVNQHLGNFFDTTLELQPLTHTEARNVIQSRLGNMHTLDDSVLARREPHELQPRLMVTIARAIVTGATMPAADGGAAARRTELWNKVTALGRPTAMLVTEMRSRGPVSASDEGLLQALGWSRSRASSLLAALARAGLATETEEQGANGRPRKLYVLAPDLQ